MKLLLAVLLLAAVASVCSSAVDQEASQIYQAWKHYFHREYSESEDIYRLQVFKDNLERIKKLNEAYPDSTFAPNKFADLGPEEFTSIYLTEFNEERKLPSSSQH